MSIRVIHRSYLKDHDIVFYCTQAYSFKSNWLDWDQQDSCPFNEIIGTREIIFGCIRKGIFHYVED